MDQPLDPTPHLKVIIGDLVLQLATLMAERDRLRAELDARTAKTDTSSA